jgi:hypothetical protein
MVLKWFGLVVGAALCCGGCSKGGGNRVNDLLSRQEEHARQISQMSKKVDSVDEKLTNIEKSINALLGVGSGTDSAKGGGPRATSTFSSTEEYKNIMRQMDVLQQQVAVVQGEFVGFQNEERQASEQQALRDRGAAWRAMTQPEELTRRLDLLAKNFSGKIADGATRKQFVSDVEAMKAQYSATLSPDEKREEARKLLTEQMSSAQNDRETGRLERQMQELDSAQGAQQMEERADRVIQFQRMRELGELTRKYNIPDETVRDSGLVSFGRGGGPGSGPGGGRRGG